MSAMKSGASLRALILTPERIPSFIIPSSRSPFLASPMFRRNSSERSRLLSEDDDEDQTESSPLGTPTNPGASSRRRLRLRTPRGRRPHHAAADCADADPTTRAAMSLTHVPKVTTPYGFRGVLATTPNTSRRESLFHRNRPVKVTVNDAEPDGGPAGTTPPPPAAAAGPEGTGRSRVSLQPVKALGLQVIKELKRPAAALMALSPSHRCSAHR
ncbi:C2 calcium-dependent domain-containing protein 4C-like [Girardinichthys multiradiatus]|uniref:C2 calcium-dependent domain-containing protein 4C-like n=1 Tax=Girardinichthys multiradiatus TaxID=208333 RepID=UPI001FAE2CD3|nr:C2 calcium-dependent domain-containing protein 4C-like [Girardinichthys multiradiatus]XP_047239778.1 C2 calcium-dependent domain-containing protein 4C-like [Girardinichthys multiradiatus]XP_047239779.1 C2 calcium-dependent domain-containing protein 4C-like [Girardinichthys multiradiatus]XP_047239780.1 C2 calcium-dependent domain-containing protein 4C-like [Girardinichthys multiradiatus]